MPTVNQIAPESASQEIKELYAMVEQMEGLVPVPLKVMSNHPGYFKAVLAKMQAVMGSTEIDQKTKLVVALAVSTLNNCEYCIQMYSDKLKKSGFSDKQFVELMGLIDMVGGMNSFNNGLLIKP